MANPSTPTAGKNSAQTASQSSVQTASRDAAQTASQGSAQTASRDAAQTASQAAQKAAGGSAGRPPFRLDERRFGFQDLIRIPLSLAAVPSAAWIALALLGGLLPTGELIATAAFLDAVLRYAIGQAPIAAIAGPLVALGVLGAVGWMLPNATGLLRSRCGIQLMQALRPAILEKKARLAYRHLENPADQDVIRRVAEQPETHFISAINNLMVLAALVLRLAGLLILVARLVWWAALAMLLLIIPLAGLAIRSGKANYDAEKATTASLRRAKGYLAMLTGRAARDERTLFGYTGLVNDRWLHAYETARKTRFRLQSGWYVRMKAGGLLMALLSTALIGVLIHPAAVGLISLGSFISLAGAVLNTVQMMSWNLNVSLSAVSQEKEYLRDLRTFAGLTDEPGALAQPDADAAVLHRLDVEDLVFAYPGTSERVLDGLTFSLEAGQQIAIVGSNGAGKTTLVNLLLGLYQPDQGRILVDGRDITLLTPEKRKALFSVVFQDFTQYPVSLRDNIALGATMRVDDSALREALDVGGLEAAAARLPAGWLTPLGKVESDSSDLSGGEWQRVALARAWINPAPLRILDEPTAALDPISESAVYADFKRISQGKTTVYISHRLGSTQLADRILVLNRGRIVEQGTHEQLMSADSLYAAMYESQRSWYR